MSLEPAGSNPPLLFSPPEKRQALIASVHQGRRTTIWIASLAVGAGLIGLLFLFAHHFRNFGPIWLGFKGLAAVGTAVGVRVATRRARGAARELPDHEAAAILKPLTLHPDESTRQVAQRVLKGLREEGTEVTPAAPPEGLGNEGVAGEAPAPRASRRPG